MKTIKDSKPLKENPPVLLRDFVNKYSEFLERGTTNELTLFYDIGKDHGVSAESFYFSASACCISNGLGMIEGALLDSGIRNNPEIMGDLESLLIEIIERINQIRKDMVA